MSPEKSLNESVGNTTNMIRAIDDIDKLITLRNHNIEHSRKERESRVSYTSKSKDSGSQYTFSNSKNLFLSSAKPLDKYEMVNDSFGSPEAKFLRSKRILQGKREGEVEGDEGNRKENNDHIISGLGKQERKLETFIPPSRIEPVPISLEQNDLPIAYMSSPDIISYQYEDISSPPK